LVSPFIKRSFPYFSPASVFSSIATIQGYSAKTVDAEVLVPNILVMVPSGLARPQVERGLGVWMMMGAGVVVVVVVVTGFSRLQQTKPGAQMALKFRQTKT
jgi:uncharacterized membrane protein